MMTLLTRSFKTVVHQWHIPLLYFAGLFVFSTLLSLPLHHAIGARAGRYVAVQHLQEDFDLVMLSDFGERLQGIFAYFSRHVTWTLPFYILFLIALFAGLIHTLYKGQPEYPADQQPTGDPSKAATFLYGSMRYFGLTFRIKFGVIAVAAVLTVMYAVVLTAIGSAMFKASVNENWSILVVLLGVLFWVGVLAVLTIYADYATIASIRDPAIRLGEALQFGFRFLTSQLSKTMIAYVLISVCKIILVILGAVLLLSIPKTSPILISTHFIAQQLVLLALCFCKVWQVTTRFYLLVDLNPVRKAVYIN